MMKLFRSKAILVTSICAASILGACQQENDGALAPQSEATRSDQNARTAVAAGTLIKDGNASLAYYNQSAPLLWKEIYGPSTYTEFIHTPQLVTAKKYQNSCYNSANDHKYTLDTYGRCVQLVTNLATYIFEYNANSQLTKYYNKDNPKEKVTFSYATNANSYKKPLYLVSFYDKQGANTKEIILGYGAPAEFIMDMDHLNPVGLPAGVSKYLPIFGIFSTHLVKSTIEKTYLPNGQLGSSTQCLYSYTLNYLGKSSNITVKKLDGTPVSSTDRKYSVPKFGF